MFALAFWATVVTVCFAVVGMPLVLWLSAFEARSRIHFSLLLGLPFSPKDLSELEVLRQVPEAIEALRAEGFELIMVTNQPDVARGITSREIVEAINNHLRFELGLDGVATCYHDDTDNCESRKPKPGMLRTVEKQRNIDLAKSFIVGDRWRDIEAGRAAGCRTIFLDYGYAEPSPATQADYVCKTRYQAADWIKANRSR